MNHINNQCEILMSYAPAQLFTTETTSSPQEKKTEQRCVKLVDTFYRIDSKVHSRIRNLLHELESSLLLICNTVALRDTFEACGRLQARFEHHRKHVQNTVKSEFMLKEYYNVLQKADWFGTVLIEVLDKAAKHGFEVDIQQCKQYYFDAMKDEQLIIKGD